MKIPGLDGYWRHTHNTIKVLRNHLRMVQAERDDLAASLKISRATLRTRNDTIEGLRRELAEERQHRLINDVLREQ